jgi:hypothetical protein
VISARITAAGTGLDLDGNGVVDVATDVVYLARHELGLSPVPPSFRQQDPTIPPDTTIAANIAALCGPPGTAALVGRLLDTNAFVAGGVEVPVVNARVSLLGAGVSTTSNEEGYFTLSWLPAGKQVFDIDTSTANTAPDGSPYAGFREAITLTEGIVNVVERPFFLPRIAVESLVTVDPNTTTVVTNATLGVSMTVPPHTAKTAGGADFTGQLSISLVPDALAPASLPEELQPGLLITIQPVGVTFATPVPITFPNIDNLPPGSETDLWSLDPEQGIFVVVGTGRVSADGQRIETISGGVRAADWHFDLPPNPLPDGDDPDNDDPDKCKDCTSGSQTAVSPGSLTETHTLVSYRTLGQARALRLMYNSLHADPQPVIHTNVTIPGRAAVPPAVSARLSVAGVEQGGAVFTDTSGLNENVDETLRQVVQFDASGLATGRYPYQLTLTSHYAQSAIASVLPGHVLVNNQQASPFGAGWGLDGLQRLQLDSEGNALLSDGNGSLQFARLDVCTPPPAGLVSWWPGDGDASDIQNANPGGLGGGASFAPGIVGQAFSFDGVDGHVNAGGSTTLTPPSITVDFWMNARSVRSNFTHPMSHWGHQDFNLSSWIFQYAPEQTIFFCVVSVTQGQACAGPTAFIPFNRWHHLAGTYDGIAVKVYLDGQLVGQTPLSGAIAASPFGVTSIGCKFSDGIFGHCFFSLNGLIDEAEVHNRALTEAEIEAIFVAGSAGKCQTLPPTAVKIFQGNKSL